MKPLSFDPARLLEALKRSGWALVSSSTPKSLLDPFCEEHGLIVCEPACYTVTLRPKVAVAETEAEKAAKWEKIRKEREAKRQKNAVKKKEKESKL